MEILLRLQRSYLKMQINDRRLCLDFARGSQEDGQVQNKVVLGR